MLDRRKSAILKPYAVNFYFASDFSSARLDSGAGGAPWKCFLRTTPELAQNAQLKCRGSLLLRPACLFILIRECTDLCKGLP